MVSMWGCGHKTVPHLTPSPQVLEEEPATIGLGGQEEEEEEEGLGALTDVPSVEELCTWQRRLWELAA